MIFNYFQKNVSFPFVEVQPKYFVMQTKPTRIIGALMSILLVLITSTIMYSTSEDFYEYFVITVILCVWPIPAVLSSYQMRTYVIDQNDGMYEFYIGEKLIYRGHLHNIYIRLTAVNSGGSTWHYTVVINGYMIEEYPVTPYYSSLRREHLARMGRRLAQKLDINFFDCADKSRTHNIRNRCPYRNQALGGMGLPGLPAINIA